MDLCSFSRISSEAGFKGRPLKAPPSSVKPRLVQAVPRDMAQTKLSLAVRTELACQLCFAVRKTGVHEKKDEKRRRVSPFSEEHG